MKKKPITPKVYPSVYRCVLCDKSITKKELWSTEAMELDDSSCVCESCVPRWNERQNKPLRELIGTVKIHKSMLAMLQEEQKERKFQRKLKANSNDPLDNFSDFMVSALENPDMRNQLLVIVSQNSFHRASIINTIVRDMQLTSAPQQLVDFLIALKDDKIAKKAKEMLDHK